MLQITDINTDCIYNVTVEKLSNTGLGIAKLNGYVLFIPDSCPGDELSVKITKKIKNTGMLKLLML